MSKTLDKEFKSFWFNLKIKLITKYDI